MTTKTNPYQIFTDLTKAGWKRNFDISPGGRDIVIPVSGAPSIGSCPGDLLFAGCFTKQDGTSILMRSNMDRSITTFVLDPMGYLTHSFRHRHLYQAGDAIDKLNII